MDLFFFSFSIKRVNAADAAIQKVAESRFRTCGIRNEPRKLSDAHNIPNSDQRDHSFVLVLLCMR